MTSSQLQLPAQVSNLRADLSRMTREFEAALPQQIPVDRFVRTIVTAVQMQPELLEADRRTLISSCMKAAQDGLLLDGREAGLSVYNDRQKGGKTVSYLPMVGGIMKKIRQSGEISSIRAHVVYEGDVFEYELGDEERILHRPSLSAQGGKALAAYAIARFKDGDIQREVMSLAQIEKIRAKSTGIGKHCWTSDWGEMAKKTVIRRLAKRLPSSNDLDRVLDSDNVNYEQITPVTVTEAAPQQIETVSVEALNRQIAAGQQPTAPVHGEAVAVSLTDSGEVVMVESVAAEPESAQATREDPF
jgi:recombination protein RecT